ncbi:hypothetical protein [Nocardioides panaciterrulae]|uniref:Uncharacterized protein n=1 Tax=Nocardioides panaciterrulae TaxID=661492 RepID=A0A7Y9E5B7_9ACTN|nr:hypothetical protein [Nocardioides panaciterrulae]NYD41369.1 hypothetical protein [Nocardioides panaciterrulae]
MTRLLALLVGSLLAMSLVGPFAGPFVGQPGAQAAPARVSRVVLVDGTGDVWRIGPGEDTWHFFGTKPEVDLTGATAAHRAHEVRVTMRFVDLRRVRPQEFQVRVRTPETFRRAIVSTAPDGWAGTDRLLDRHERVRACPGLHHRVDYPADRVVVGIPRGCLGTPDRVRVALSAYYWRPMSTLADNPHDDGPPGPAYTRWLAAPSG